MNCCPLCKGETGFHYTYVSRRSQWFDWDFEGVSNEDGSLLRESKKKCMDCGKIVEVDIANRKILTEEANKQGGGK